MRRRLVHLLVLEAMILACVAGVGAWSATHRQLPTFYYRGPLRKTLPGDTALGPGIGSWMPWPGGDPVQTPAAIATGTRARAAPAR